MSQFTKEEIIKSFTRLLNEKSLDKITVTEIVKDCNINRNTFYYYFEDIYDLIREVFLIEGSKFLKKWPIYESWQDVFLDVMDFLLDNDEAIYSVYNSLAKNRLERFLYDITDELMIGYVEKESQGLSVSEEDKRVISDFYKFALAGIVLDWIDRGMKDEPKKIVDNLNRVLDGSIKVTLKNTQAT